jgi:uroporphyrinogen-III synthase
LWLGSATGIERAKQVAAADAHIDFLAVYENVPADPAKLVEQHTELSAAASPETGLHLLTSRASAEAFTAYAQTLSNRPWHLSCFGASAAEQARVEGFNVYHESMAGTFEDYVREIEGGRHTDAA